ncbi:hypothetical protein PLICRDRAFT_47470, partial [Plicaturopsis crispa FD-325 SS-3]
MPGAPIPSSSSSQLPCEFCDVSGHVQADCSLFIAARASACKRRRRKPAAKRSKPLKLALSDFAAPERAGSAGLRSSDVHTPLLVDAEHDWNADTGATSHMTPHRHCTVIYSAGVGSVVFNPRISGKSADPVLFVASINDDHAAFLDGETQACTEFAKLASTLPLDLALWH